jgi:phenylalanyl-tRNA synthetase beta chain
MRVSLEWLSQYVSPLPDAAAVAKALTMAGVGIDAVDADVLTLEITSNRADLLSVLGVARELGVVLGAKYAAPEIKPNGLNASPGVAVEVANKAQCPRYLARVVRGVKIGPAPAWMQKRLTAALGADYLPVNNVADITNFVMLECGQPLHAFDLRNVRGSKIIVRPAAKGEKITAINAKEYALEETDIVIADAQRPVAIAGVMGGKDSEIGPATVDVLIESAMFDAVSIRRTSRRLGLASESSYRFERGVDFDGVDWASLRAAQLMAEIAGGTIAPGAADVAVSRTVKGPIRLRYRRIEKLLGMKVSRERVKEIVQRLGARVEDDQPEFLLVRPPSFRRDITGEVDFVEEVARIEGYDKIPTDVQLGLSVAKDNREDLVRAQLVSTLVACGAFEVLTWSFEDASAAPSVTMWSPGRLLTLRNPKGHIDRTLRNALGPALVKVLRTNEGCGEDLHPVFEIAHVYFEPPDGDAPGEKAILGIAHPGGLAGARALLAAAFDRLQLPLELGPLEAGWAEAGRTVVLGGEKIGYLGRLGKFGVAEVDYDKFWRAASVIKRANAFSIHPAVRRDIAMVFPKEVLWPAIDEAIRSAGVPTLASFGYLNHFEGKQIGEGRRSVAVSLTFLAADRTLTGAEVDEAVKKVTAVLQAKLGASQR